MAGPPDDVMRTLLAHEKKSSKMDIPAGEDRESSSSDSDDETSRSSKPGMFGATTLPPAGSYNLYFIAFTFEKTMNNYYLEVYLDKLFENTSVV